MLVIKNVRKTFNKGTVNEKKALRGINLTLNDGDFVTIIGGNGAGKSTLLHILGGLLKPSSGTVRIPRNIGFVFQAYHLMPELTVLENVILPTYARGRIRGKVARLRARELLEKVGLADRMDHLPAELSGGERQRVALARALVTDPEVVFADEPTGNLDELTGADILRMLTELSKGATALVMVTHSRDAAAICNRTLTLADGVLK